MTAAFIIVLVALGCFVASLLPQVPEQYSLSVGGLLLAVVLLVGMRS